METPTLQKQKELTPLQIASIAKTKFHYYIFLLLTLAREPINQEVVQKLFGQRNIQSATADLIESKIAYLDHNHVTSFVKEFKFPKAFSGEQKEIYKKFDEWDLSFYREMDFKILLQKMLIRRVSPRFLSIILGQCSALLDLVRASEETDQSYNDEILQLTITMASGNLPG